ncbi:hypothetical protein L486_03804 [Kwoniella mangroviensis CBS 10435]|uniref:Uncharacterized protein n=1 Tax=Kwoniella mangroviensis CBS 10435 TaxID=1331196 RepID=A0A1B9IUT3_9TREE|nr:hypothetical protein L486_03804 [Kwoniella mangroviensis CBS 10435]
MTPSSWGNVDLISEIFKTTPSGDSGPTESSVILYCPKSRNGTNQSETFTVERKWYDSVQSEDIAKQVDLELSSIFQNCLDQYPYSCLGNGKIRIQRVSNDDYDSLMKIKRSLYPKGRKGVMVIPRKSNSTINKEITNGGRLTELGITKSSYMKDEEDREMALKELSEYANSTEQSIKGWPLRAIYPLDERLGKKLREYEDYGYVFLDEDEIKTFRSIMEELPSIPGRPVNSYNTHVLKVTDSSATEIPNPSDCEPSAEEDMVITIDNDDERYRHETPFLPRNARAGDMTYALESYRPLTSKSADSRQ